MTWSRRSVMRAGLAGSVSLALGLAPREAAAGSARIATIIARALSYERTLPARMGPALVLGIVYADGDAASETDRDTWSTAFAGLDGVKVNGAPLQLTTLAWGSGAGAELLGRGVDVVLVCEGLDGALSEIADFTAANHLLSVGAVRAYVDGRCTLGVFDVDGKPRITINLAVAEREGVKFSSRLLKLADVIR